MNRSTIQTVINVGVDQHWYVGRPAFLADWSLSGLRTWDGIRAVDYLVLGTEVDPDKLAAVWDALHHVPCLSFHHYGINIKI